MDPLFTFIAYFGWDVGWGGWDKTERDGAEEVPLVMCSSIMYPSTCGVSCVCAWQNLGKLEDFTRTFGS